jgi:ferredoxin
MAFKAVVGSVSFDVEPGTSVMDAAIAAGVIIHHTCGGRGICLTCQFTLVEGELTSPSEHEIRVRDILKGKRQACQCSLAADSRLKFAFPVFGESGENIDDAWEEN